MSRTAALNRRTAETAITINVNLDGSGRADVRTGLGFLDHMLTALARHSAIDISLSCDGDLQIDDHHTAEDCALALGASVDLALGERTDITRFGHAYAPLDEALSRAVIDLSGRPCPVIALDLRRERIGDISCENLTHFFRSFAVAIRASVHVDVLRGENDHHRAEAAFKALALALREAIRLRPGSGVPSTKGVL